MCRLFSSLAQCNAIVAGRFGIALGPMRYETYPDVLRLPYASRLSGENFECISRYVEMLLAVAPQIIRERFMA